MVVLQIHHAAAGVSGILGVDARVVVVGGVGHLFFPLSDIAPACLLLLALLALVAWAVD